MTFEEFAATRLPALHAARGPSGQVDSITASPDGSHLAISTDVQHGNTDDVQNLIVASIATGTERRWTTPRQDSGGSMGPIRWLAGSRTLAVNWLGFSSATPSSLRLLDTAAPGTDPLSGRAVLPLNPSQFSDLSISPDGRMLIGIADHPKSAPVVQARLLYQPPAVRDKWTGMTLNSNCLDPLWISNSGQQVLLMCTLPRPEGPQRIASIPHILLLDHGRVIRLPWLTGIGPAITAFGG
jgi:dipeptidyl aminopeptidase/acylaminoacyl peptidase